MKKITPILLAALFLAAITVSCSKEGTSPDPASDEINYLVMWYAVGGENLDDGQMANVLQALDYGSTDKVKMTFEYKLSRTSSMASFQDDDRFKNFNGTRRFTSDENANFKGTVVKDSLKAALKADDIEYLCKNINSMHIGDTSYVMASDTALTSFINWSRNLYPKAKNLILVLGNHGGGWSLTDDGKHDCTKAIEYDDNIHNSPALSAKDIERAIQASCEKRIKMIYTDACLMSVHENYETYAKVTDYALSAVEYTPGAGGNYYTLLESLNSTSGDDEGLWNASTSYIDYLNTCWWRKEWYCDLGIFDLRNNSSLTAVCKSISEKLASCWKEETPITPGGELKLWKEHIRNAVSRCEVCVSASSFSDKYVPASIKPFLLEAGIKPDSKGKYYETIKFVAWLTGNSESIKKARQTDSLGVIKLQEYVACKSHEEYCLADLLSVLNKTLAEGGVAEANNPFIKLRSDYISALKSMSYINCTDKTSEADYAYNHCGPGIFLYSFNASSWGQGYVEYFKFGKMELNDAIRYYESSDFDKATSWSSFLKLNDAVPSLITNPSRGSE